MFHELNQQDQLTEDNSNDYVTQEAPEVAPALLQVVNLVREDCRRDAETYLRQTEVQYGGE